MINIEQNNVNWGDDFNTSLHSLDMSLLGVLRYLPFDCFSYGQLHAKLHCVEKLKPYLFDNVNILVCGGWVGMLPWLLFQAHSSINITNIEIDKSLEKINKQLNSKYSYTFLHQNLLTYTNYSNYDIIINTSTEHLARENYIDWMHSLPNNKLLLIQNNNMTNIADHINCFQTIDEFIKTVPYKIVYCLCTSYPTYDRFTILCKT